jgi:hypothetical protein
VSKQLSRANPEELITENKQRNSLLFPRISLAAMNETKKPIPPVEVIDEDSGPPLAGVEEQQNSNAVDIDDAQIEESKDDAFKKPGQSEAKPKRARKRA